MSTADEIGERAAPLAESLQRLLARDPHASRDAVLTAFVEVLDDETMADAIGGFALVGCAYMGGDAFRAAMLAAIDRAEAH